SKINFAGDGRIINTSDGINFYTNLPGDVKLTGIYIDEVAVTGFGHNGIRIGGWNGRSGFRDIRITHALLQDNGLNGLVTYAQSPHANELVYIGHVRSCRNSGLPTATPSSGSGIVLGGVDEGIVEWSIAHDNGWLGNAGVGIWTYASTNITIQYNESFDNRTAGHADGGGFDLDGGVTHSVLQYNYSHGNDGAGYGLFQYKEASPWFGNTVRHNMSINDGRKNDFAGIQVWNGGSSLAAAEIYDNVVVMGTSEQGIPSALSFKTGSSGFFLHHNTFIATGEARLITIAPWQEQLRVADNRCWSMVRDALQDEGLDRTWCEEYHHL
ncbi:MAG: right-handed parallel beta-helix repeat-containing protein, partial [Nitrospiraceae bacterium]